MVLGSTNAIECISLLMFYQFDFHPWQRVLDTTFLWWSFFNNLLYLSGCIWIIQSSKLIKLTIKTQGVTRIVYINRGRRSHNVECRSRNETWAQEVYPPKHAFVALYLMIYCTFSAFYGWWQAFSTMVTGNRFLASIFCLYL